MKYKPELTPDAEIDVSEAFEWYESRRKGLGHDFLLQVDAGLQSIGRTLIVLSNVIKESVAISSNDFRTKFYIALRDEMLLY